jgi:hypothetical protein
MIKFVYVLFYQVAKGEKKLYGVYGNAKLMETAIKQIKKTVKNATVDFAKEMVIE